MLVKARAHERVMGNPVGGFRRLRPPNEGLVQTAVDGNVLLGTLKHGRKDQPPVHLLSWYECESGIVLDQFLVASKHHEESACRAILHPVLVKRRIITDAIFRSRPWCATVHASQGYSVIPNRRGVTLREDASQVRVRRAPEVFVALNGVLLALLDFQGVKNVAKQMRHFARNHAKLSNCYLASFHGTTGKLQSPGVIVHGL